MLVCSHSKSIEEPVLESTPEFVSSDHAALALRIHEASSKSFRLDRKEFRVRLKKEETLSMYASCVRMLEIAEHEDDISDLENIIEKLLEEIEQICVELEVIRLDHEGSQRNWEILMQRDDEFRKLGKPIEFPDIPMYIEEEVSSREVSSGEASYGEALSMFVFLCLIPLLMCFTERLRLPPA